MLRTPDNEVNVNRDESVTEDRKEWEARRKGVMG
jgi:hypothetical protein